MQSLKNKTVIITGGSRGIGMTIALKCASENANVVVLTKDSQKNIDNLETKIVESGGKALLLDTDISDYDAMKEAVTQALKKFKTIDVLINNTSATCFTNSSTTSPKQFDLVISTSVRAAFFLAQICLPYLKNTSNPHIINISPPIEMHSSYFKNHLPFSIAKYAMSMCTLGMAAEFADTNIAVNSLWPETTIATQTIKDHFSDEVYSSSRWPAIMGDAAYELISRPSSDFSGCFYTDEALLSEAGMKDFSQYAVDSNFPLMQALFVPENKARIPVPSDLFLINQ